VRFDKPKMLTGLSQKASGWLILLRLDYRNMKPPDDRQSLTRSCYLNGTR
jgi:hypothetical protein